MTALSYRPLDGEGARPFALVADQGTDREQRFEFGDRIEIGRLQPGAPEYQGRLLVDDPTVSSLHCVLVRHPDGRLFARDTSRNGTRLDGIRLIPNREQEVHPGQTLSVGNDVSLLLLEEETPGDADAAVPAPTRGTLVQSSAQELTVVVGDVRGYTSLLTSVPGAALQASVAAVFARLVGTIRSFGGQVKEYQGDSIMAFWEQTGVESPAVAACRAVLALDRDVAMLSGDPDIWPFPDRPLRMDWAVTTGRVSVQVLGADRPEELSLVGEPVVLAYRLEKAANDDTGPTLTCERTRREAGDWFDFGEVGPLRLDGFDAPVRAFRLLGESRRSGGRQATLELRRPRE